MLDLFLKDQVTVAREYSLTDTLKRFYENQLTLETDLMELTLWVDQQTPLEVGENVRGALHTIGENAVHIKLGLACLRGTNRR